MTIYSMPLNAPVGPSGVRREMDRLVDEIFGSGAPLRQHDAWIPATDAVEHATGYTFHIDLPGVPADQLEVTAEDGVLTVKGERAVTSAPEGARVLLAERPAGLFERRFRLPKAADTSAIEATHAHGTLTVSVPKVAPAQPRRVQIEVK